LVAVGWCPPARLAIAQRWRLNSSPRTGVWGRAPSLIGSSALCAAPLKSSGTDYHQVEFLGSDPSSLQPPQIDYQLPTDGHDGLLLEGRIRACQDFLPFLDWLILGLKQDHPPDHLGNDPPNGRDSHFGNGATPFSDSGTPFAPMVCVKLPKSVLVVFHLFKSNEVAIFWGLKLKTD
jgi:hypothetical protein